MFGCLFLTTMNRLIPDEELSCGSVDGTAVCRCAGNARSPVASRRYGFLVGAVGAFGTGQPVVAREVIGAGDGTTLGTSRTPRDRRALRGRQDGEQVIGGVVERTLDDARGQAPGQDLQFLDGAHPEVDLGAADAGVA